MALTTRILILGGASPASMLLYSLKNSFRADDIEITLVSDENFVLFTPMLPEVPSSSIEAKHIITPIRAFFRKVNFQNSTVLSVDLERRRVLVSHCPTCQKSELTFQHLVLALGFTTDFYGLPGVAENALPMKSLTDVMLLRNHVIDIFEHADLRSDPAVRKSMLAFVVADGGFAGAETVAELHDFAYTSRRYYSNIRPEEVRVLLVHSGSRIMPEISADLADYALRKLRERGVEVFLNTRIVSATPSWVELSTKERIATATLVWTAGLKPSPLLATLACARNRRGQIVVNEYLEVPDQPGVWAVGDCAEIPDSKTGRVYSPTAQHANREGKTVAQNIFASINGGTRRQFIYKPLGMLASLGRRSAVAEICGFKFSGFFAWWLWRTIYLFKSPGLERKVRVAMDWTLDLFFARDIVLLKVLKQRAASELPVDTAPPDLESRSKQAS